MSLVADYAITSSSDSDDSSSNEASDIKLSTVTEIGKQTDKLLLPKADLLLAKKPGGDESIFNNRFKAAEFAKTALLERHVKMVKKDEHLTLKNGRKICWNNRKGRCRFGSNCHYAHDSDLSVNTNQLNSLDKPESTKQQATQYTTLPVHHLTTQDVDEELKPTKRKRPGLSDSMQPGKRVMNAYQQQKQHTKKS